MDHAHIADGRFGRKMKVFYFQIFNSPGIQSYQNHGREKNFQGIAFMQAEKDFQEMFGIVNSHKIG